MNAAQQIFDKLNDLSCTVKNAYCIDFVYQLDNILFNEPKIFKELFALIIKDNAALSIGVMISLLTLTHQNNSEFKQEYKDLYLETWKKLVQKGDINPGGTLAGLE